VIFLGLGIVPPEFCEGRDSWIAVFRRRQAGGKILETGAGGRVVMVEFLEFKVEGKKCGLI
jgi:hypothetical protein